jgi:glycosyltransferase involved in cell wall biosynthesis
MQFPEARLRLVGDGPDEGLVRDRARRLKNVEVEAFVQKDALPATYGWADVFVFPTFGDPYGHVVQEAMAAGLPVIASRAAGDIEERVVQGESGLIVTSESVAELHEAMVTLARDSQLREKMGAAGRTLIAPRTVQNWADEMATLLRHAQVGKLRYAEDVV